MADRIPDARGHLAPLRGRLALESAWLDGVNDGPVVALIAEQEGVSRRILGEIVGTALADDAGGVQIGCWRFAPVARNRYPKDARADLPHLAIPDLVASIPAEALREGSICHLVGGVADDALDRLAFDELIRRVAAIVIAQAAPPSHESMDALENLAGTDCPIFRIDCDGSDLPGDRRSTKKCFRWQSGSWDPLACSHVTWWSAVCRAVPRRAWRQRVIRVFQRVDETLRECRNAIEFELLTREEAGTPRDWRDARASARSAFTEGDALLRSSLADGIQELIMEDWRARTARATFEEIVREEHVERYRKREEKTFFQRFTDALFGETPTVQSIRHVSWRIPANLVGDHRQAVSGQTRAIRLDVHGAARRVLAEIEHRAKVVRGDGSDGPFMSNDVESAILHGFRVALESHKAQIADLLEKRARTATDRIVTTKRAIADYPEEESQWLRDVLLQLPQAPDGFEVVDPVFEPFIAAEERKEEQAKLDTIRLGEMNLLVANLARAVSEMEATEDDFLSVGERVKGVLVDTARRICPSMKSTRGIDRPLSVG